MHVSRTLFPVSAVAVLLSTSAVFAATFPDVPEGHIFQEPIEQLVGASVINGNPDGNFYPDRDVNRAEMLKMLYLAKGIIPDPTNVKCFPDVPPGSWFESYVCDAAARQHVKGYADGDFRPGNTVNRVEALKMIQEVFGFTIDELDDSHRDIVKFVDVSVSAWYTKYLFNAYDVGILPIAGQDNSRFYPDQGLKRGEAAAMIYNTLNADIRLQREEAESSSSSSSQESSVSSEPEEVDDPNILEVEYPFTGNGKFDGKKTFSYRFSIDEDLLSKMNIELQSGQPGTVSCTLFLLKDDGISDRYYLGSKSGRNCDLLVALSPGNYQLQLQPSQADTTFSVTTETTTDGDDNDGFREASSITVSSSTTYVMESQNFNDWYQFFISEEDGQRLMVEMTNKENLLCLIYPMDDVDLYGFSGPQCNQFYQYPSGTYYVGVIRTASPSTRQTYTIRLRE